MPRQPAIGATRDSHVYQVRVPGALRVEWDAYCAKHNRQSAEHLRALMRSLIDGDLPPELRAGLYRHAEGMPDHDPPARVHVTFTRSEYEGLTARAALWGCSVQRWIVNCVRHSLTHQPQFGMEDTKALWESSYQLRAVGRNLNQIAKAMNEGKEATITTTQIEKLWRYIQQHTEKVSVVLGGSLGRWQLTPPSRKALDDGKQP
jgi:hypothetical protein